MKKAFSGRLPKLFGHKKGSSKRLVKAVSESTPHDGKRSKHNFPALVDGVIERLWIAARGSPSHAGQTVDSELQTLTSRLELGLQKVDFEAPTLLRVITSLHRVLMEGPNVVSRSAHISAALHYLGQVASKQIEKLSAAEQPLEEAALLSKKLYLLATQYSSVCHERLQILRQYGVLIAPDWSSEHVFTPDEQDAMMTLLPPRDTAGDAILSRLDSESPEAPVKVPERARVTTMGAVSALLDYSVSLSLALSRVSSNVRRSETVAEWVLELSTVLLCECRGVYRALTTLLVCVLFEQTMPAPDNLRFADFVRKYPRRKFCGEDSDDPAAWILQRRESERCRRIVEKRLTRWADLKSGGTKRVCCCQYGLNGGESFLLMAATAALHNEIYSYYFEGGDERWDEAKKSYSVIMRLHTSAAPSSLKRLTALSKKQDDFLAFHDSVGNSLRTLRQVPLCWQTTNLSAQVDGQVPSEYTVPTIARLQSVGSSRLSARGISETSTTVPLPESLAESEDQAEVSMNFKHIVSCDSLPRLSTCSAAVVRKIRRAPTSVDNKSPFPATHVVIPPECLPDRRLLQDLFSALNEFLNSVTNSQMSMLSERKRSLRERSPSGNDKCDTPTPAPRDPIMGQCRNLVAKTHTVPSNSHPTDTQTTVQASPTPQTPVETWRAIPVGPKVVSQSAQFPQPTSASPLPSFQLQTVRSQSSVKALQTSPLAPYARSTGGNIFYSRSVDASSTQDQLLTPPPPRRFIQDPRSQREMPRLPTTEFLSPSTSRLTYRHDRPRSQSVSRHLIYRGSVQTHSPPRSSPVTECSQHSAVPIRYRVRRSSSVDAVERYQIVHQRGSITRTEHVAAASMYRPVLLPAQERLKPMTYTAPSAKQNTLSPKPYSICWSTILFDREVGRGATAIVYRGWWQGTEIAIKVFQKSNGKDVAQEVIRELQIVFRLRHPNLVLVMGALPGRSSPELPGAIVSEFCAGGTLFDVLHGRGRDRRGRVILTWRQRLKIAIDVARGCNYLHSFSPPVVHRDLKSLNILLAEPIKNSKVIPLAKISDFGMSVLKGAPSVDPERVMLRGVAGTYHWMAPEVVLGRDYRESVDIYSFGIILYELATAAIPFSEYRHMSPDKIGRLVAHEGVRPSLALLPLDTPPLLRSLMEACWAPRPEDRPTCRKVIEVLSHPDLW